MNSKGQVAETMTWIFAFIIIFFIMFLFFFSSMFIKADTRGFEVKQSKDNVALTKTTFAFMKNESGQDFWQSLDSAINKSEAYYGNISEIKFVQEVKNP